MTIVYQAMALNLAFGFVYFVIVFFYDYEIGKSFTKYGKKGNLSVWLYVLFMVALL